ncbi:MAG TPA: hypothetical protein VKB76_00480 [Ktedonobacterales bacterium]|nr:hypothetical protein [Ktedonobacterales bacterium]
MKAATRVQRQHIFHCQRVTSGRSLRDTSNATRPASPISVSTATSAVMAVAIDVKLMTMPWHFAELLATQ